jgi:hypothetical protein
MILERDTTTRKEKTMAARVKNHRHISEETEHDTGIKFDLYMHGRTKEFLVKWGNKQFAGPVAADLIKQMREIIRNENQLKFKPVIVVHEKPPFASKAPFVCFTYERCYVAERPGKNRAAARLNWEDYQGQGDLQVYKTRLHPPGDFRYDVTNLPLVFKGQSGNTYVLDYAEALWEGLITLYMMVKEMQERFRAILGTSEGQARISEVGGKAMLPATVMGANDAD